MERKGMSSRPQKDQALNCPRCHSTNTKFCYYNNYSLTQPRYFCKTCRRYWTQGGTLRNVPVGGGSRKIKKDITPSSSSSNSTHKIDDNIIPATTTNLGFQSQIINPLYYHKTLREDDLNLGFSSSLLQDYHHHHHPLPSTSSNTTTTTSFAGLENIVRRTTVFGGTGVGADLNIINNSSFNNIMGSSSSSTSTITSTSTPSTTASGFSFHDLNPTVSFISTGDIDDAEMIQEKSNYGSGRVLMFPLFGGGAMNSKQVSSAEGRGVSTTTTTHHEAAPAMDQSSINAYNWNGMLGRSSGSW